MCAARSYGSVDVIASSDAGAVTRGRASFSSSTRGGHPPFLAPYFAAKAAMDALAESYAAELIRFGILQQLRASRPVGRDKYRGKVSRRFGHWNAQE